MNLRLSLRSLEQYSLVVSQLLVALMMACMLGTIVQFGSRLDPNWDGSYLPWVALFVTLEAMYTRRITKHLSTPAEWVASRAAELVVLLLALKALLYLLHGPAQFWVDLARYRTDFAGSFFGGDFALSAVLTVLVWILGTIFGEDLDAMGGDEVLLGDEVPVGVAAERMQVRQSLANRVFYIGLGMVFLAALARFDFPFVFGNLVPIQGSVLNLLAYFLLALALLSQTQLAILRASWTWERIPLNRDLAKRWTVYGLIFLALLVAIALVLPTNYTVGLLAVLQALISMFFMVFAFLWTLLLMGITSLLSLAGLGLISGKTEPLVLPKFKFAVPNTASYQPVAWLELAKSVLFWAIFLGVIGFSLYQYLSQHRELLDALRRLPGMTWLGQAWKRLVEWVRGVNTSLSAAVEAGWQRLRPARQEGQPRELWGYVNLRGMPPRERVRFFYLALVRRGQESGIPRAPDQTPFEYGQMLTKALQESAAKTAREPGGESKDEGVPLSPLPSPLDSSALQDLESLTGAFMEARYSRHPISEEAAGQARTWWQRVRRVLKRNK